MYTVQFLHIVTDTHFYFDSSHFIKCNMVTCNLFFIFYDIEIFETFGLSFPPPTVFNTKFLILSLSDIFLKLSLIYIFLAKSLCT